MPYDAGILIVLGAILIVSLVADVIARATVLPRVSILVLLGIALAPLLEIFFGVPGLVGLRGLAESLISIALTMVAFLLGGDLTVKRLRDCGRAILTVSIAVVLASALFVGGGLYLLGVPPAVAILLAGIATATDPAATREVVHANGRPSAFGKIILGVVAIDDAWGIILFGLAIAVISYMTGNDTVGTVVTPLYELGGAIAMGAVLGVPAAYLTGRLHPGQPLQVEALGLVLLCTGLAQWLAISPLLAAMTMGVVVANLARHHTRSFREIENIEWPFLVFFFVFAGASIDLAVPWPVVFVTIAYIVLRIAGRVAGGWIGGNAGHMAPAESRRVGLALTPQAGVALGMALLAADKFPELAATLLSTTVIATVFFEIFGPVMINLALRKKAGGTRP